jgi:hypothetical protein
VELRVAFDRKRPADVAHSLGERARLYAHAKEIKSDGWRRETFALPRPEAREKAKEFFARFPKQAYMTEVETWRELEDGRIEFTMRRLPTAD